VRGAGYFSSPPTGELEIHEGDGFFLYPGIAHSYGPRPGQSWEEYWCIFSGHLPDSYLANGLFSPRSALFTSPEPGGYENLWGTLMRQAEENAPAERIAAQLLDLIARAASSSRPSPGTVGRKGERLLERLEEIRHRIASGIGTGGFNLVEYAQTTGYSYVHLRRAFTRTYGVSPERYRADLLAAQAKARLLERDTPIKEIAAALEFEDQYYFSRFFKKTTGMSPTAFRQSHSNWSTG
jgi:AraC-like DNA-binding protein